MGRESASFVAPRGDRGTFSFAAVLQRIGAVFGVVASAAPCLPRLGVLGTEGEPRGTERFTLLALGDAPTAFRDVTRGTGGLRSGVESLCAQRFGQGVVGRELRGVVIRDCVDGTRTLLGVRELTLLGVLG